MEIAVTGLDDLDRLADRLRPGSADQDAALAHFLTVYREALDRVIPVRTGTMRSRVRVTAGGGEALVEIDTNYAIYVVLGVQAQWMTWLVGHTVAFTAKSGERVVRRVARVGMWGGRSHWWHPGVAPNDVFRRALDDPRVAVALDELAEGGSPVSVAYTYAGRG